MRRKTVFDKERGGRDGKAGVAQPLSIIYSVLGRIECPPKTRTALLFPHPRKG